MAFCWVKAGACEQESSIKTLKVDSTHVAFEITTTCERIQALAEALDEVDVAHDMACRLDETQVYRLAVEHVCRNSCIVPAAIFLPGDCSIEFVEGAI